MANKKKKPAVELNNDIDWDYSSYQGRSKKQVANNETIDYYTGLILVFFVIGHFLYWIFSSI
jgi:hypothetical protein